MRVYLDNCCYNRPYDDQSYLAISLETQAKLYIQDMIRGGKVELATSYILDFENGENPYEARRQTIKDFTDKFETAYVTPGRNKDVLKIATEIEKTGIKHKDACHLACAIISESDYFITTDKRILKYKSDRIRVISPVDFITEEGQ